MDIIESRENVPRPLEIHVEPVVASRWPQPLEMKINLWKHRDTPPVIGDQGKTRKLALRTKKGFQLIGIEEKPPATSRRPLQIGIKENL